jgi:hypothetical protein
MISRRPQPESSAPRKQRRGGRNGWPLAEAKSAQIPEADRRAIKLAIAEWGVAPKALAHREIAKSCDGSVRQELAQKLRARTINFSSA